MPPTSRLSYAFGTFRLDADEKLLFQDDRPIPLTPKAAETLLALVERHGRLVTKEELLRLVWPDTFVEENNLAQNISMLRRVLGDGAEGRPLIETVPKRGYRFVGPVSERREGDPHGDAEASPKPERTGLTPRRALVSGLIAAVAFAVAWAAWSRLVLRTSKATPATSPASAHEATGREGLARVAVLPFVNLGAPDDAYFVAGVTEEITSRLAGLRRLAVSSSTTVTQYDRRGKDVRRIGADLGVAYLVEGSVRWARTGAGTRVRISPKLIRVADDTAIWTHQYDGSLDDLFGVQADIAFQVAGALPVALDDAERLRVEVRPTADAEAYLAYLRGKAAYLQGGSDTSNQAQARADFESAVARDEPFALAWAWLARVYEAQYNTGAQRNPEVRQAAQRAARTAIELDPDLPEAHLAMGHVLGGEREYDHAFQELEAARAGLPNSVEVFRLISGLEQRRGRWPEALQAYRRAFELEPATIAESIAVLYLRFRQYDEAARFLGIAKAGHRASAAVPEAWMRFCEGGDVAAARRVLEPALAARSPADARVRGFLARLEWFDGNHQRALELIEGMEAAGAWLPEDFRFPASIAAGEVYESLGRHEDARRSFAAAVAELERRKRGAPDDYQVEAAMCMAEAGLGQGAEAIRYCDRAVELLPVSRDAAAGPLYLYLLARTQARFGQEAAAFATLDRMFGVPGFYNETWVERDPGFAALRKEPSFAAHVQRWSLRRGDALLARPGAP